MYLPLPAFCLVFLLSLSKGQSSVPSDLSSGFDPSSLTLQVIYGSGGENDHGFTDGTKFTSDQTASAPTFALGDASGVNTATSFVIMMLDTTTDNDRVLHFMQTGVKATGDETALASQTKPVVAYQAPGTMGDTGARKYSWLMYSAPSTFTPSSMPSSGSSFNVQDFLSKNSLSPAVAGVGMQVQVSGGSTGSASTQQAGSPSSNPAPAGSASTVTAPSGATVPSTAATSSALVVPPLSSLIPPGASQMFTQPTAAVGSPTTTVMAPSASGTGSGNMSNMSMGASAMTASSTLGASAGGASAGGASAGGSGATATTSSAIVQASGNAVAQRGNAFAAIPLFILAGAFLG